jgi:hypothetical protein
MIDINDALNAMNGLPINVKVDYSTFIAAPNSHRSGLLSILLHECSW